MKLNVDVYLHFANSTSFPIDVKIKNLDFGKSLLGRLWLFAYGMWSFLGGLRSFFVVCGYFVVVFVGVHLIIVVLSLET